MIRCETNLHFLNNQKLIFIIHNEAPNRTEKTVMDHHFQEPGFGDAKKPNCLFEFNLHNHMR